MDAAQEIEALKLALQASERRLAALAHTYPVGVYYCDSTGARTYVNRRWQEIIGLSDTQGLGHGWLDALHPDDRQPVADALNASMAQGRPFDREFRAVGPDGAVRVLRSQGHPVAIGEPDQGFVGALEDVTAQRENEQRLRASEAFLDRTGRLAKVGGWELDIDSGLVTWSTATRAMHEVDDQFQPTLESALGFYPAEVRPRVNAAIQDAVDAGTSWDLEAPFVTARGRRLWTRSLGEAQYEGGRAVRLIGAFQDISEQRARQVVLEHEQALRRQSESHASELDRLLAERSEMLEVLAHEVRQPLNNASAALQGATGALLTLGKDLAGGRVARAQTVLAEVMASIDNTLAVASLLATSGPIEHEDTDIDTLIAVSIADLPLGLRSRVRLHRHTETRTASMDMGLMRLALRNLLTNALKFSPPDGDVTIRVADSDEPLALVIDVADQGPGVSQDLLPRLFTRGARGAHAGAPHGHGLGLYIVRRVMELHRGQVELARNAPDGVTFRLWVTQAAH
jgi:PAS domain S-box-containing protein